MPTDRRSLVRLLAGAGIVSADDEAAVLLASANGDRERLESLVRRRMTGEPLAWITGTACFCGLRIAVRPGVYVPRAQTQQLARRAAARLPPRGLGVDLCTGSGAVARVIAVARPGAQVVASDIDPAAVACAVANGVEAYEGDLFEPLPAELEGRVDVVVAVVPYVPTARLASLQRDTFTFESPRAYDGGPDGTRVLRRAVAGSVRFLRAGGALLLELGGDQADLLRDDLARLGFADVRELVDEDGDVRGVESTWTGVYGASHPSP